MGIKTVITIAYLVLALKCFAPTPAGIKMETIKEEIVIDIEDNIKELKSGKYMLKDYYKLYKLALPIIANESKAFKDSFVLSKEDLDMVIMVIALSEGSKLTKKGIVPFYNRIFVIDNNPFGIQGKGTRYPTHEYIDGTKTRMFLNFRKFKDFQEAIRYLLNMWVARKRYKELKTTKNGTEFFYALKRSGYFTSPTYHKTFFIPYFKKIKSKHDNNNATNSRRRVKSNRKAWQEE